MGSDCLLKSNISRSVPMTIAVACTELIATHCGAMCNENATSLINDKYKRILWGESFQ